MTIKCVVWTVFLMPLLTGCTSIGPGKLVPTHEGYNDAVQLTMTREVLKNIVRERYHDPVQFLRVASINDALINALIADRSRLALEKVALKAGATRC